MYTIGVVVTVYNKQSYVERALKSLLDQHVFPEQLIIVNDKSTDNSDHIIKDFLPRLKAEINEVLYVALEENKGAAEARNSALRLIHTDFIVFLDADDQYELNYIQNLKFLLRKDIGLIASKVKMESKPICYPSDKVLSSMIKQDVFYEVNQPFTTMAIESLFVGGGNLCFKRSLMQNEWFVIHESNFEEWDFYYRILKIALKSGLKFIYNPLVGYIYNDLDDQSLSRKYLQNIEQIKIPILIKRIEEKTELGYKGLLISIWCYNSLSRLKSFRQKIQFVTMNCQLLRLMQMNRYSWGSILQFIIPKRYIDRLKERYKKKRYK